MRLLAAGFPALLIFCLGCSQSQPAAPAGTVDSPPLAAAISADTLPARIESGHLPNLVRVHEKVISGGLPERNAAFAELRALGIKTIISVDGAKPDVEMAQKHGLRYVHLPHGYNGISAERAEELAKAVNDLEGPIYIHCHHGKHRSPAAAAVACVGAGLIADDVALVVLETAGTSPAYRGLYQSAAAARPIDPARLASLPGDFPSVAKLPALAEAMVALEHTHDHVKQLQAGDWRSPAASPDLTAPHEALLLREHYTELIRLAGSESRPAELLALLRAGETSAQQLETQLAQWEQAGRPAAAHDELRASLERVNQNCASCHKQFRDVPLGEKQSR